MGIGLEIIAAIPTTIGTAQAISAQKREEETRKKAAKFNLSCRLPDGTERSIVLRQGLLYLTQTATTAAEKDSHPFTGYYFKYPGEEDLEGLVSTISVDPPMLNWVFVDRETREVRYGTRSDSVGHIVGGWGWTEDEERLVLDGDEGFFAVDVGGGDSWQLFFDVQGDGSGVLGRGRVEGVGLKRVMVGTGPAVVA